MARFSFPCAGFIYVYLAFHRSWPCAVERAGFFACFAIEGFLILLNLYSFIVYTHSYLPYIRRAIGHGEEARQGEETAIRESKDVALDYASRARQAAVAAVEARVARDEIQKRKSAHQAHAKGCLSWLILLSVAAAVGLYLFCRHSGMGLNEVNMRIHETIKECFPAAR